MGLGAWLTKWLVDPAAVAVGLAGLSVVVPAAPLWSQGLALVGAVVIVLPLAWRLRACGIAMVVPCCGSREHAAKWALRADRAGRVGQRPHRAHRHARLIYDAGPACVPGADAGERVLLLLLRHRACGGWTRWCSATGTPITYGAAADPWLPVAQLSSSLEPEHLLLQAGLPHRPLRGRAALGLDGVQFELLHPASGLQSDKPNVRSCKLGIRDAEGRTALLLGDLPAEEERQFGPVSPLCAPMLLLVPHHGSKTSSSPELLAATQPAVAPAAGYRSRFGHPAPPVLARYQAAGITVIDSPGLRRLTWDSRTPPAQGRVHAHQQPRIGPTALRPPSRRRRSRCRGRSCLRRRRRRGWRRHRRAGVVTQARRTARPRSITANA